MECSLVAAVGLMLVLEGIIPFLFPQHWRAAFSRAVKFTDGQIRFLGLAALVCGLGTLLLFRLLD